MSNAELERIKQNELYEKKLEKAHEDIINGNIVRKTIEELRELAGG